MSDETQRLSLLEHLRRTLAVDPPEVSLGGIDARAATRPTGELPQGTPQQLGRHRVAGRLGAGGMGEVLLIHDTDLGRALAAKVVLPKAGGVDAAALSKFLLEAQVTGQLEHPGIPPVHELGLAEDGRLYFTMKRVEGRTLGQAMAVGALGLGEGLEAFLKICDAVGFAHSRGVIHRDLKPDNIMLGGFGATMVMDWGLAKVVGTEDPFALCVSPDLSSLDGGSLKTLDGTIMGTPAYMPPEQARGEVERLDARSDVYALGAILYELLTGAPPHDGKTAWAVLEAVLGGEIVPPAERSPDRQVPWELAAVAMKALDAEPDRRYADVAALRADIAAFLEGRMVGAARYSALGAFSKWAARHRIAVSAMVLVTAVLLGAWGWIARERAGAARLAESQRAELAASAREQVRESGFMAAIKRARIATEGLDPDPARRTAPTATELERNAKLIDALRTASDALAVLIRRAPQDTKARKAQYLVLCALGRVAEASFDDTLARVVYGQAAALGEDDGTAQKLARIAGTAHSMRLKKRRQTISEALTRVRRGRLTNPAEYRELVLTLASYHDRQTVEMLLPVIRATTEILLASVRATMSEAAILTADERASRLTPLKGLRQAVDVWLDPDRRASQKQLALINDGAARLEARGRRTLHAGNSTWKTIIAERQRVALLEREDMISTSRLAAEVLGLIGDPVGVVEPLGRMVALDWDEHRAVPGGIALARLARRDPAARNWIETLIGRTLEQGSESHFDASGPFWRQVRRVMPAAGGAEELGSGPASIRRAQLLLYRKDYAGALAELGRCLGATPLDGRLHYLRARAYRESGKVPEALRALDRALELTPSHGPSLTLRAQIRRNQGKHAAALADVRSALAQLPEDPLLIALRGDLRMFLGDRDAISDIRTAQARAPKNTTILRMLASAHMKREEFAAALRAASTAVEVDAANPHAYHTRGLVYARMGRDAEAIADYDEALRLGVEDSHRTFSMRGVSRLRRGDLNGAHHDCARAARSEPDYAPIVINLAAVYLARRELEKAVAAYRRATELAPEMKGSWSGLAGALFEQGEFEQSEKIYTEMIERFPRDAGGYVGRAAIFRHRSLFARAKQELDKAVAIDERSVTALIERANLRRVQRDRKGAIQDLNRALSLAPRNAKALATRAAVKLALGDPQGALKDYNAAFASDPRNPKAATGRAAVLLATKRNEDAITAATEALELDPRRVWALNIRGVANRRLGRLDPAMRDFSRAIQVDPRYVPARINRASIRGQRGDHAGAESDLDVAIANDPHHMEALYQRAHFRLLQAKLSGADRDIRKAIALKPRDWRLHRKHAEVLNRQRKRPETIAALKRALALAPAAARPSLEQAIARLGGK